MRSPKLSASERDRAGGDQGELGDLLRPEPGRRHPLHFALVPESVVTRVQFNTDRPKIGKDPGIKLLVLPRPRPESRHRAILTTRARIDGVGSVLGLGPTDLGNDLVIGGG